MELEVVVRRLAAAAYSRVDLVERRGEFAVRGGIVDVFPPTEQHPVRIEFWGDEVEEVRSFAVADQRSLDVVPQGLWAPPCRELLLTDAVRARARELAAEHPELSDMLERLAEGHAVEGMESLAPALVDEMEMLIDLLPADSVVLVCDPERVRGRAHDLVATSTEFLHASWAAAAGGGTAPVDVGAAAYHTLADVRTLALGRGMSWWSLSPFGIDATGYDGAPDEARVLRTETGEVVSFDVDTSSSRRDGRVRHARRRHVPRRHGCRDGGHRAGSCGTAGLSSSSPKGTGPVSAWSRCSTTMTSPPASSTTSIRESSRRAGAVESSRSSRAASSTGSSPSRSGSSCSPATTSRASAPPPRTLGGCRRGGAGKSTRSSCSLATTSSTSSTASGATSRWSSAPSPERPASTSSSSTPPPSAASPPTGSSCRPTSSTRSPAMSAESIRRLDRLGGGDWNRRKGRARRAVRQIAAELIKLYAARQATRGHAFGPDSPWQRELEDAFPYVETPDQLASVEEVKRDMEQPIPMDRLICGDVGYGKTEIAIRAAFKAVQDGKQVAVLVPTTLFVQQHQQTFSERFAGFPVDREAAEPVPERRRGHGRRRRVWHRAPWTW